MVTLCSHLFWPPALPDGTHRFTEQQPVYAKSLECMKRAIKIIRENNPNPALFVEILDRYVKVCGLACCTIARCRNGLS